MALKSVANGMGLPLDSVMVNTYSSQQTSTMDASGESAAFIGKVYIEGAASSKTISSAGGKIAFRTGAVTFADGGTNVRIGIQDLTSAGVNDDVFDVYADFTGGGGGLASNTFYEKSMTNGSKTINHLDIVAITFEMTARGGSDSVVIISYLSVNSNSSSINFPYRVQDIGAGPARQSSGAAGVVIIFDDGTIGWLDGTIFINFTAATVTYNVNSTPDEYAAVFKTPYKCSIRGGYLQIGSIASTDNFEVVLYSDAEGTPIAERTVTIDPNYTGGASGSYPYWVSFSPLTLTPGVWYALSMRPTTTNNLNITYYDFTSTFGNKYKKMLPFGTDCKVSSRTNQSGAFSEVQSYYQPIFGLLIDQLDDGAGGSSVEVAGSHP